MPTFPGIHPNFDITKYSGKNRATIRRIAEFFYVTRGFDPVQIGNSVYQGLLVRPTDESSIYLNTDREIVVVLADYETFEIRTLEAFDQFYDLLELKRIDTSIRFLVSSDSAIETSISQYIQQNPEYPIIIPITYDNLEKNTNPLIRAVRQNYVIRDLFGYQSPLRQEHFFFGRHDIVNSVLDLAKSGQNSSLFGLRKSGKTSTIFAIRRKSKSFDTTAIQIDCQSPAIHGRRYDELLSFVQSEVAKAVGLKGSKFQSGLSTVDVAEQFSADMKNILQRSKSSILIIFDEIEQISPLTAASAHWRTEQDPILFWQVLRSFSQSESNGRLSICVVGTSPYLLESAKINGVDNPVYLFAQKRFIQNLSFDDMRVMVRRLGHFMGLNFPDQILFKIHTTYGGHPFFTRQVCSKIHQIAPKQRPLDVSINLLSEAEAAFRSDLETYLKDIVNNLRELYPEEYKLLADVVVGDVDEFIELAEVAPDLVDHLLGYGLIEKRGNDYDITLDAIKSAVERITTSLPNRNSRWSEINIRRNCLEQDIRAALYYWSQSIERENWVNILRKGISNKNFEALSSTEPNIIFSRNSSPLFLTDLAGLLKLDETLPHLKSQKSIITQNLFGLNSLRRDAHARDFTDAEYISAVTHLNALEKLFGAPV